MKTIQLLGYPPYSGTPQKYPLVNQQAAMEHGWFIVGLPCKKMVMFHSYIGLPEGNPMTEYEMPTLRVLKMNTSNTRLGCTEGHFRAIGWIWLMYAAIVTNIHQDWEETILFMYL